MKRKSIVFEILLTLVLAAGVVVFTVPSRSEAYSRDETEKLLRDCTQLLMMSKMPTSAQQKMIDDLDGKVRSGEMKREYIYDIVKDEVYIIVDHHKFSRYDIQHAMQMAPKLTPSITATDLHNIIWEKVHSVLKDTIYLKLGTLAPEGTPWLEVPRKNLNKHITKLSQGKVKIKMYVGGVMGEDVDVLRKMDVGQLDGCGCTALGVFKASPELGVFFLPMLFRNYAEVDHIFKKFRDEFDGSMKERGYILASLIDTGFFYLWSTNPVESLADIRKQKLMTWFGPIETAMYQELGISPIPISVPEIVSSLNTGLVNATYAPGPWLLGTQAYTNLHYYVTQPLFYSPAAIIFSTKIQDKFRGDYTDTHIHNFTELLIYETMNFEDEWIHQHLRPFEEKSMEAFKKYGIKPVTLSQKDMATIQASAQRVWYKLAGKYYSKDLLDRVVNELKAFRDKQEG